MFKCNDKEKGTKMLKRMMMVLALVFGGVPAAAEENDPLLQALRALAGINAGVGQLADVARSVGCAEKALNGKFPPGCNRENTPLDPGALIYGNPGGNGHTADGGQTIYGQVRPTYVDRDLEERRRALQEAKCRHSSFNFRMLNGCKR